MLNLYFAVVTDTDKGNEERSEKQGVLGEDE